MEPTPQLQAEAILAVTGLLVPPDRSAVIAARRIVKDLTAKAVDALDREEPMRLRVNDIKPSFIKKLMVEPDYETIVADLEELTGSLEVASAYMLAHQRARQVLIDSYPSLSVDTVVGTRPVEAIDPDSETLWCYQVDAIEHQRVILDLSAAACLPETVVAFSAAFPDMYEGIGAALQDAISKKGPKWTPPWWLDASLRVFFQAEPEESVITPEPAPPKSDKEPNMGAKALEVPGMEMPAKG